MTWQCNVIVIASEAWQSHPYVIARNEVTWQSHKNEMHFVPENYPIPFSRLL
jgi:hypothetical protein